MTRLTEFAPPGVESHDTLTLPFEARQKSRLLVRLDSGAEAGVFLSRGTVLRDGDRLLADDGRVVLVRAAAEPVSVVRTADALLFARACYHLGNRHVALQIERGELRYLWDHVLDDMVRGLGLTVEHTLMPFEPERGAYHGAHHHGH
ncbi:urease accessory protein UreE [Methylocaldum szegediense]|uniref:Urease accessory protein UreE n=1 Tax=Methylocaldum szegediense TaxID=73780 RepID=A0ABM9I620_9GAMM|nr:urease accessory protein UreE [Methylocaldum szegediense]CAI8915734.1 Urease accessory protein UreE [Methylocaldum szegediense]